MLDSFIRFSLKHRLIVVALAAFCFVYGCFAVKQLPIDVFPDLNKPTVTIITEAHGMAPEDVETLVTIPLETALAGMSGVERIRSSSAVGLAMVFVEFGWDTDIYRNRQLVAERIAMAQRDLPDEVRAVIAPITSIMGEIQLVGLSAADSSMTPMELRTLADWVVRKRLLAIPGVGQVTVLGGLERQFQILLSAEKIKYYGLSLEELQHSLSHLSNNSSGGFFLKGDQALLIRNIGMAQTIEDLEQSVVGFHFNDPILVRDIAEVQEGGPLVRFGDASVNSNPAVLLTVRKQPDISTVDLSNKVDHALAELEKNLPKNVIITPHLFRQATFIERSIKNVQEVLLDGAIIVSIVLFLFLLNLRTTFISLTAIPLSLMITFIVFKIFGLSVNTMTLGGLAIAIGELVDDAIVDVENVFRRLKEEKAKGWKRNPLKVVYLASAEIRGSIVFATIIVIAVFFPLFYLSGIEGKFFIPLGTAYIVSLLASLLVSITVTPVLCSFLLPQAAAIEKPPGKLITSLQSLDKWVLLRILNKPKSSLIAVALLFCASLTTIPFMGRSFLPVFQEGTATIVVLSKPGTSLEASNLIGARAEKIILSIPEVATVSRRTGRAREDEHVHGVNTSELDVDFHQNGRQREIVLAEIRDKLSVIENTRVNIGQPLSHRIDHMLSGINAQIAIKLFGPELSSLRRYAYQISEAIESIPGLVDLQVEAQTTIPQTKIFVLREEAAKKGVIIGELTEGLETALHGATVGQIIKNQRAIDVVAQFDTKSRADLASISELPVRTLPNGEAVRLKEVADIYSTKGPNMIAREGQRRRIVIQANAAEKDIGTIVHNIQKTINEKIDLPDGYFITYDGQFESQQRATRHILFLSFLSLIGIFIILWAHFSSAWFSAQVILSLPLAMIGGLFALFLGDRTLSIASLIGFVTLCGIASRNTIMMLSHYIHLIKEEGLPLTQETIIKGSQERLIPVLMTSLTAIFGLLPLAFAAGQPGKEILHPLAVVIIGGLISSTILDILITPVVFFNFGRKSTLKSLEKQELL